MCSMRCFWRAVGAGISSQRMTLRGSFFSANGSTGTDLGIGDNWDCPLRSNRLEPWQLSSDFRGGIYLRTYQNRHASEKNRLSVRRNRHPKQKNEPPILLDGLADRKNERASGKNGHVKRKNESPLHRHEHTADRNTVDRRLNGFACRSLYAEHHQRIGRALNLARPISLIHPNPSLPELKILVRRSRARNDTPGINTAAICLVGAGAHSSASSAR